MEDARRDEEMFFEGWVGDSEWNELTAGIKERIIVLVFAVVIKEESEVEETEKLMSVGLADKGARLKALIRIKNTGYNLYIQTYQYTWL